jgi:ABC-type bacteriocin/lantibiotic exporter with double-glycine peptidase domain
LPSKQGKCQIPSDLKDGHIRFKRFNGYWKDDFGSPSIKNITCEFNPGTLYGITGKVGSGKSSLLGAILC